ncbi:exodeoxyribonuclease VII small subunit [Vagococcus jeotgali]|uniref:exodeoxyribonuclease VII small subunit n=1 Tax=Vagococcus jeotgali TaxID=3109030 RepID=UPI002DD9DC2B|nr:exodeoxyribonuclease VII small subunit [Vagococcus sp. B2T-5]
MVELESIIKSLEVGDVPLEKALEQFKRGMELSKECQDTLADAEVTLTKMMTDDGQEVDFSVKGD